MNLPTLRNQLQHQADEIDLAVPVPLTAVLGRAARLRRRRIATAVTACGTAAALAAALLLLPSPGPSIQPAAAKTLEPGIPGHPGVVPRDELPVRKPPGSAGDYVRQGVRYREKIGGAVLQKAFIGEVGQASVSFSWTPATTDVDLRAFCTVREHQYQNIEDSDQLLVSIDGRQSTRVACGDYLPPDPGGDHLTGWSERTRPRLPLRAGRTVQVSLQLLDAAGNRTSRPASLLGIGIYQHGPMTTLGTQDKIQLAQRVEYQGYDYRISKVVRGPAPRDLSLAIPARTPGLLAFGVLDATGRFDVGLLGVGKGVGFGSERSVFTPTSEFGWQMFPAGEGGTTAVQTPQGQLTSGQRFIVLYLPVH